MLNASFFGLVDAPDREMALVVSFFCLRGYELLLDSKRDLTSSGVALTRGEIALSKAASWVA